MGIDITSLNLEQSASWKNYNNQEVYEKIKIYRDKIYKNVRFKYGNNVYQTSIFFNALPLNYSRGALSFIFSTVSTAQAFKVIFKATSMQYVCTTI